MADDVGKLALLWHGNRQARGEATPCNNRFSSVFEELARLGIHAEPAVYADDMVHEVREQLLRLDGVLVWVNPISDGRDRGALDAMLRDVASRGVWVSAHPDVILKMGVKQVLHRTKHLGWGTDTHLYRTANTFAAEFPERLQSAGSRVLKQNRGNGGQGVWKVEPVSASRDTTMVRVLQARRGSVPEDMTLPDFMKRCTAYFEAEGCIIDQPFQTRLPDGMIRCYMGKDKVVGFGHQFIKALIPPPPEGPESEAAQPGPRIMHPRSTLAFQALRRKMEEEWTPQMMQLLSIDVESLPIIWDADFLYGPRTATGEDTYVLCEINVSSVAPFPDQASEVIARLAMARLRLRKTTARGTVRCSVQQ
ncbi:MAG: Cj0069 family protein [Alphaproteobacteria bacterium]|nr:Cj0069 family protein [Alphaproteobacteria bacterium]